MKYFLKLTDGVNVMLLMNILARSPSLWGADTIRTNFKDSPHRDVEDIILRGSASPDVKEAYKDLEAVDTDAMILMPVAKVIALDVLRMVGGSRLGRIVITRLAHGGKIALHKDEGPYPEYYTRYHIVLQGLQGSLFTCGDETVNMRSSELWWFDAKSEHSVINNSHDDRVHMVVDIRID